MKDTEELLHEIRTQDNPSFLAERDYNGPSIAIYMSAVLAEQNLTVASVIRTLDLERSYGYQLFNGNRRPTRTVLIRLAALLQMDGDETNRLLNIAGREILYPRRQKDARILFALEHHWSLEQIDALLQEDT